MNDRWSESTSTSCVWNLVMTPRALSALRVSPIERISLRSIAERALVRRSAFGQGPRQASASPRAPAVAGSGRSLGGCRCRCRNAAPSSARRRSRPRGRESRVRGSARSRRGTGAVRRSAQCRRGRAAKPIRGPEWKPMRAHPTRSSGRGSVHRPRRRLALEIREGARGETRGLAPRRCNGPWRRPTCPRRHGGHPPSSNSSAPEPPLGRRSSRPPGPRSGPRRSTPTWRGRSAGRRRARPRSRRGRAVRSQVSSRVCGFSRP